MSFKKKLVTWIGRVLMLLSMMTIWNKISSSDLTFNLFYSYERFIQATFLTLLFAAIVLCFSGSFIWLTHKTTGTRLLTHQAVASYCKSNVYKYLPTGLVGYVEIGQLAKFYPYLESKQLTVNSFVITVFRTVGAFIVIVFTIFPIATEYVNSHVSRFWLFAIPTSLSVILVATLFSRSLLKKQLIKFGYNLSIIATLTFHGILRSSLLGFSFVLMLNFVGSYVPVHLFITIIGSYTLAWLIGVLVPGVVGGIGIREGVLLHLLTGIIAPQNLIQAVILHRILYTLGDVLAYVISHLYSRNISSISYYYKA